MTTNIVTARRETVGTSYSSTALYQCPSNGTVKHATIVYALVKNITTTNATLTIADVASGTPGTAEATTNQYINPKTIPANTEVSLSIVGDRLLPGEFINELSGTASSLIIKLAILEELT